MVLQLLRASFARSAAVMGLLAAVVATHDQAPVELASQVLELADGRPVGVAPDQATVMPPS